MGSLFFRIFRTSLYGAIIIGRRNAKVLTGLLFVLGGIILCKYGLAAILGGLGAVLVALGVKKGS